MNIALHKLTEPMIKFCIYRILFLIATFAPIIASAQLPYSTRVGFANNSGGLTGTSTFSCWSPSTADVPVLKGVFFITARSPMCTYIASTDSVFRRGAQTLGYAIVLADGPIITDWKTGLSWSDSLVAGLARLGGQLQRPEMQNLPLIVFGHSLGTNFSRGISYDFSERILGAIHFKLGSGLVPTWANAQQVSGFQQVPYCAVNGEIEGPDINQGANTILAATHRQQVLQERLSLNVPGHHVVEYNGNHNTIPARLSQLLIKFIDKCMTYRIPNGANFLNGPTTLTTIDQTQGYIGLTTTFNDFTANNIVTNAYNAASAQSQFYLFDQDYADAWKAFHIAPMTSTLSTSGPLCLGQQGVSVSINSLPAVNYGPNNVFRVQLSSVLANFESGSYYPMNVGYIKSQDPSAQIPIFIPDNLHQLGTATPLMPNAVNAQGTYRYTFRVISTDPPLESANTSFVEIAPSATCTEPELFIRFSTFASNADQVYQGISWCSGRDSSFNLTILKRSTGPSFTGTNEMVVELSDTSGSFNNPVELVRKTTLLPTASNNNTWFRDTINVRFGSNIRPGMNYRVRVRSTDPPTTGSTAGMVLHIQNCVTVGLNETMRSEVLPVVYPNPSAGQFIVKSSVETADQVQADVYHLTGQMVTTLEGVKTTNGYSFNAEKLTSGSYIVKFKHLLKRPYNLLIKR